MNLVVSGCDMLSEKKIVVTVKTEDVLKEIENAMFSLLNTKVYYLQLYGTTGRRRPMLPKKIETSPWRATRMIS